MSALLPASYYLSEIQHLLSTAGTLPPAERVDFMTGYLEALLQPVPELIEVLVCPACEGYGFTTLDINTPGDFGPDFDYCPPCSACGGTGEHPGTLEAPSCLACGHFDTPGDTCASCGVCQSCLEHADDCTCPRPAGERFQAASAAAFVD